MTKDVTLQDFFKEAVLSNDRDKDKVIFKTEDVKWMEMAERLSRYESLTDEAMKKSSEELSYFFKSPIYYTGGKAKFFKKFSHLFNVEMKRYIEPFFGGGGVFFGLNPKVAVLGDINRDLMFFYKELKRDPKSLIEDMVGFQNTKKDYYTVRRMDRNLLFDNLTPSYKAARFYYLNQMSYNGLYRVNKNGEFNAPYGYRKWEFEPKVANLISVSKKLNEDGITLFLGDFRDCLKDIKKGDFIYLDPPIMKSVRYHRTDFTLADMEELKEICDRATNKGARFLMTYKLNLRVIELFKDYEITTFKNLRKVNSDITNRKNIEDIIIKNY